MRDYINAAKLLVLVLVFTLSLGAGANSVGFSSPTYSPDNGQLVVTVVYDYTDFAMAGGGFDLLYDAGTLEFVSFTLGPAVLNAQWSLTGSVV